MARRKKHTPVQIVSLLRQIEVAVGGWPILLLNTSPTTNEGAPSLAPFAARVGLTDLRPTVLLPMN